jgi:hypothetical protein
LGSAKKTGGEFEKERIKYKDDKNKGEYDSKKKEEASKSKKNEERGLEEKK